MAQQALRLVTLSSHSPSSTFSIRPTVFLAPPITNRSQTPPRTAPRAHLFHTSRAPPQKLSPSPALRPQDALNNRRERQIQPCRHFSHFGSSGRLRRRHGQHGKVYKDDLDGIYDDLTSEPRSTTPPPSSSSSSTTPAARARIVFGSRLLGPAERRRELAANSRLIAGILVPPKPAEPDNCCMSGCVNCVWDRYREELEEWNGKMGEVRRVEREKGRGGGEGGGRGGAREVGVGGSGSGEGGHGEDELLSDIPVGIREFMRTEKRLKERRRREKDVLAAG